MQKLIISIENWLSRKSQRCLIQALHRARSGVIQDVYLARGLPRIYLDVAKKKYDVTKDEFLAVRTVLKQIS